VLPIHRESKLSLSQLAARSILGTPRFSVSPSWSRRTCSPARPTSSLHVAFFRLPLLRRLCSPPTPPLCHTNSHELERLLFGGDVWFRHVFVTLFPPPPPPLFYACPILFLHSARLSTNPASHADSNSRRLAALKQETPFSSLDLGFQSCCLTRISAPGSPSPRRVFLD